MLTLMPSTAAISAFVLSPTSRRATSRCRGVSQAQHEVSPKAPASKLITPRGRSLTPPTSGSGQKFDHVFAGLGPEPMGSGGRLE